MILFCFLIFIQAFISSASGNVFEFKNNVWYTLVGDQIVEGKNDSGYASAIYNFNQSETGWNIFDVESNPAFDDDLQAYTAGYLEGALTATEIYNAWLTYINNTIEGFNGEIPAELYSFISSNSLWLQIQSKQAFQKPVKTEEDQYWSQVYLVLQQVEGIIEGYNKFAPSSQKLSTAEFYLFQYDAEIFDIATGINLTQVVSKNPKVNMKRDHCSSLVKITPDGNLYSSQVTWTSFTGLLRMYKNYNLPFALNSTKSNISSFSGYPGYLPSGDDWYITDQGLTVAETTNDVFNNTLYWLYINDKTVPYWIRCMVANKMSSGGQEWSNIFAKYNSGTYNNQWIIVDFKLYTPGKKLLPNTLWIAEQIPGYVISNDQTNVLEKNTYWASYNIPYSQFVYDISGYPAAFSEYGNDYSYTNNPRALIFDRDHHNVVDMDTMKTIMRYNKWQTDPLSLGDACNGISARCDLNPPENQPDAFGAIDAKITDMINVKQMLTKAVAGPTWDSQPVFSWTNEWIGYPHYEEVQVYAFDFVDMKPQSQT